MKNILILTGRYLPGYRDGGPVRTIKNLTDGLGDKYHFTVCCADRDHGDTKPYESVKINDINHVGNADVFYVRDGKYSFNTIRKLSNLNDLMYVCGPYNGYAVKALILNRLGLIKCPFVLAPMGSFSKGALAIKSKKKQVFLGLMKALGLFKNISFSVTSEVEKKELKEAMKLTNRCFVAEDPMRSPDSLKMTGGENMPSENESDLKVVFLSRICEKKNLLGAIRMLADVRGKIIFHVYGNKEDNEYAEKCFAEAEKLPENISYKYMGEAESEKVPFILSQYDIFLFPTLGENFGHVISEALMAGVIPVISDTTPWLDFNEKKAGYVIPLSDSEKFTEVIGSLSKKDADEISKMSENAKAYYREKYEEALRKNGYVEMFDELLR